MVAIESGVVIGPLNREQWAKQRCVVIGGAGFLGTHLVEQLARRDAQVVVFDVVPYRGDMPKIESIVGDLQDQPALEKALQGASVAFLVASPSPFLRDEVIFHNVNVKGTKKVIAACRAVGVNRLVLTSSCSVLWSGVDLHNADESAPYADPPIDPYTRTKIQQEKIVLEANDASLMTVALRPHSIFGPGDKLALSMVEKSQSGQLKFTIGNGKNLSDFTFVGNVVASHLLAAERLKPGSPVCGKAYNITNDEPIGFWEFAGRVQDKLGLPRARFHLPYSLILGISILMQLIFTLLSPIVKIDTTFTPQVVRLAGTHHYYNCSRAKKDLDYRPFISLSEGIDRSVAYVIAKQREQKKK